jgi:integrase
MAGRVRHLINRSGRYFARLVVPKDLRVFVGKTELRIALGGDYRQAVKLLPGAVAQLQHEIALAERKAGEGQVRLAPARYPLAPDQLAASLYAQRLAFDDQLRNDTRYALVGIDDVHVGNLRSAIAGRCSDVELAALVGRQIERFRAAGNLTAELGSDDWRTIARALCAAELEALARVAERDEGDFTGKPEHPLIANAQPPEEPHQPVSLSKLWEAYVASRTQAGFMRDEGRRQDSVIKSLRAYLKHDDASRVTRKELLDWRDHLMASLSAKTVNDIYLSTIRSLFLWAHENERLPENVAATVKQPKPRKVQARERGYTDAEAVAVLKAARSHVPKPNQFGYVRETPHMTAAKRWAPILCAFSGARISEITQLRKEDVRQEGGRWVMRITPDAGTVKSGGYRDVPLHRQIVALGFIDLVEAAESGPIFHGATDPAKYATAAASVSDEVAKWLRRSEVTPEGVQPNHGWRHRLKTQAMELGLNMRVIDAMQGHSGRTAGETYGDVTLKARFAAIDQLPEYDLR